MGYSPLLNIGKWKVETPNNYESIEILKFPLLLVENQPLDFKPHGYTMPQVLPPTLRRWLPWSRAVHLQLPAGASGWLNMARRQGTRWKPYNLCINPRGFLLDFPPNPSKLVKLCWIPNMDKLFPVEIPRTIPYTNPVRDWLIGCLIPKEEDVLICVFRFAV